MYQTHQNIPSYYKFLSCYDCSRLKRGESDQERLEKKNELSCSDVGLSDTVISKHAHLFLEIIRNFLHPSIRCLDGTGWDTVHQPWLSDVVLICLNQALPHHPHDLISKVILKE